MSTSIRLAIAIAISFILVFSIAFVFLYLAESGTPVTDEDNVRDIVIALDGTEWNTDSKGRKSLSELFHTELSGKLHIERAGDESMLFSFDGNTVIVNFSENILSGFFNGESFSVTVSRSHTGEGEAVSILSGETLIVFH